MIGTIPVGASDDVGDEGGISSSSSVDKNQPADPRSHTPVIRNTTLLYDGSSPTNSMVDPIDCDFVFYLLNTSIGAVFEA